MSDPGSIRVPSSGPATASIMVVGEAPGAQEEREGRPFCGPAGNLLKELLASAGINPSDVYYTNLCKYKPKGNEFSTLAHHPDSLHPALEEGLEELAREIETVNPALIIPLGNYPLYFLTGANSWGSDGPTGIGDFRGSILPGRGPAHGRKCVPTYHPSAVLRQYPLKPIVRVDLRRAAQQSGFREVRTPDKALILDPRGAERDAWVAWLTSPEGTLSPPVQLGPTGPETRLPSRPFGSGDIEYVGSKLVCFGFTRHPDIAVVIGCLNQPDIEVCRAICESGVPWCFQNGMFDCSILEWHYGFDLVRHLKHDTMVMMHVAYTEFPKDLGFIASLYTDQPNWKGMVDWKRVARGEQPLSEVYHYNAIDTWVTQAAAEEMLQDELSDPELARIYAYEMSLVRPLWEIGKTGVLVDQDRMSDLRATLDSEAADCQAGLAFLNGGKSLNPRSSRAVASFVYETLALKKRGPKTPSGEYKMDDGTLADLLLHAETAAQRTGIALIRNARERLSLISKFCEIELDDDGRMRCHYDPAKTQTGRLASRKFYPTGRGANLQNVPRDDRVRSVFVPDPGYVFGYADLKSAESLVVAHISGDPKMLELHSDEYMRGGKDGHKFVASFLFDKPIDRITKDERYMGKRTRHAGNYSLGWYRFMQYINADAQTTGVSITAAEARVFINKYRALHPYLQVWWRDVQNQLQRTRVIRTVPFEHLEPDGSAQWITRPHTFFDRIDSILPEAIAYAPQGTVAMVLNEGLLRAARSPVLADLGFQMILQVHDAIGFQVPISTWRDAIPVLQSCMDVKLQINRRGVDPYQLSIPVDTKLGWNWGEVGQEKQPDGSVIITNPDGLVDWTKFNPEERRNAA